MKIGITGAPGMLGWHLRCYLRQFADVEVLPADRSLFSSSEAMDRFVNEVDAIAHLAGQNRGDDGEIAATNVSLAESLVSACERNHRTPHVVYSSTIHIEKDNAYGRSKREAGEILDDWAQRSGAKYSELVLPHIYGEGTRPHYNSVVATFSHQLANGEEPTIHSDGQLELLHAQEVSAEIYQQLREETTGQSHPRGTLIRVSEVLEKLKGFSQSYAELVIPDLRDKFDLRLFNVYRFYLFPNAYPTALTKNTDARGSLVEMVKNRNGGQAFFSTTEPGITRGDHFHYEKIERFLVVRGRARISIRRLYADRAVEFDVSGDEPAFIDMPTLHTHNITNTGDDELLTLFWSSEIFDPERPDTLAEPV
ncbi:MAG: NAD-dependent epimerase/dehydratase family protein [Pseudomonadota bacterium]